MAERQRSFIATFCRRKLTRFGESVWIELRRLQLLVVRRVIDK